KNGIQDLRKVISNFFVNYIEGQEFLDLTQEELQDGLELGPAKRIVKLINKIKGENVKTHHVSQVICEMISADLHVHDEIKVFGVLTDLNETWSIYWIEGKHIKTLTLNSRETSENSSKMDIGGFPKIQRTKFKYMYGSPNDDIEEMNSM
ncbi:5700_t:CDS:2, partial [Gigaspora margarita]